MQELIVIDEIAEGQFGNIFLMKEDFNYYCLKQLRKESIQKYEVAKFIVNEKKIF